MKISQVIEFLNKVLLENGDCEFIAFGGRSELGPGGNKPGRFDVLTTDKVITLEERWEIYSLFLKATKFSDDTPLLKNIAHMPNDDDRNRWIMVP